MSSGHAPEHEFKRLTMGSTHKTIYMPATPYHDKSRHGLRQSVWTVIAGDYDLYKRQAMALYYVLEHDGMTIQNYEQLCPETNRRTLQRDLKAMMDKRLVVSGGLPTS